MTRIFSFMRPWRFSAVVAFLLGCILLLISYHLTVEQEFWKDSTHEIGFALIVAVCIWGVFEFFAQSQREEQWIRRIEAMSKNVFMGVFRRNLPEKMIKEATLLLLEHDFVRRDAHITYTITDHEYKARDNILRKFVKLNSTARFKVKNVSEEKKNYEVRIGLPNPLIDEMKPHCGVNRIFYKVDGEEIVFNLDAPEATFREGMKDDKKYQIPFIAGQIQVGSDQEIELFFDYFMAKEEEDSELFHTGIPTDGVNITIVDTNPHMRIVRARSVHRSPLNDNTSMSVSGTYLFTLDDFLLPHQGFVIWWKNYPPAPPAAPVVAKPT
jgi:hypothetical protein